MHTHVAAARLSLVSLTERLVPVFSLRSIFLVPSRLFLVWGYSALFLVVSQTFSGVLWNVSMIIASGYIRREAGDILAACDFEVRQIQ